MKWKLWYLQEAGGGKLTKINMGIILWVFKVAELIFGLNFILKTDLRNDTHIVFVKIFPLPSPLGAQFWIYHQNTSRIEFIDPETPVDTSFALFESLKFKSTILNVLLKWWNTKKHILKMWYLKVRKRGEENISGICEWECPKMVFMVISSLAAPQDCDTVKTSKNDFSPTRLVLMHGSMKGHFDPLHRDINLRTSWGKLIRTFLM